MVGIKANSGSLLKYAIYSNGLSFIKNVFYKIQESSSSIISFIRNENSDFNFIDLTIEIPIDLKKNYYFFYLVQSNAYFNNLTFRFLYFSSHISLNF